MSKSERAIVIIEGEPFLSSAREFKEKSMAAREAWAAFAEERGARSFIEAPWSNRLVALCFPSGKQPEGWTVPKGANRESRPKAKSADKAAFDALPSGPDPKAVFGDAITFSLCYEGPGCRGSIGIGGFFPQASIGWLGETIIAVIPHAKRAADLYLARNPDRTITNGCDTWQMPDGLREISEAEYKLMAAQHRVAEERAA